MNVDMHSRQRICTVSQFAVLCVVCLLITIKVSWVGAALSDQSNSDTAGADSAVLIWNNDDRLGGRVISSTHQELVWQADKLFRDPLHLDVNYLKEIIFPGTPQQVNSGYEVRTIDRNSILGTIVRLDESVLVMQSEIYGEVAIDRSKIVSIIQLANSQSQITGEFNLDDWQADGGQKKDWAINGLGQLAANHANSMLYRRSEFPENTLIDVDIHWDKKLDFVLAFGVPKNRRRLDELPRIETWDDSLVLSYKDSFEIILEKIDQQQKRLKLLIHWDRLKNEMVIFDERGDRLSIAKLGDYPPNVELGILIENKGPSLIVNELSARRSSAGFDATRPSIQTLSRSSLNSKLMSFDGSVWRVASDEQTTLDIPADDFCGAYMINPLENRNSKLFAVDYHTGMFIAGELVSISEERLSLQTNFAASPINLPITGLRYIRFAEPVATETEVEPPTLLHTLTTKDGTIRGALKSGTGAVDDIVRWQISGARQAIPFAQGDSAIKLQEPPNEQEITDSNFHDTLFLNNRDIIPANVVGIYEDLVAIESFIENKTIATSQLRGVDFGMSSGAISIPLDDPKWYFGQRDKTNGLITDNKFALPAMSHLGHSALLETGAFSFDILLSASEYTSLSLCLFVKDLAEPNQNARVNLICYQGTLQVADQNQIQNNAGTKVSDRARVQIYLDNGQFVVRCNGRKLYSKAVQLDSETGRGVLFSAGSNPENLANFTQDTFANRRNLFLDQNRKELLLTIPRLKKNSAPRNIICARNSDLLRGDVVKLDERFLHLRSNEEVKQFPRGLISTIVWPDISQLNQETASEANEEAPHPDESSTAPTEVPDQIQPVGQTVQVLMKGGRQMTLTLDALENDVLSGHSQILGKCAIPVSEIYELRWGSFATQAQDAQYSDWVAKLAPAPKLESTTETSNRSFGQDSPLIGKSSPGFEVPTLTGESFTLSKSVGKVVVLDFWATWCGPCIVELPKLTSVIKNFEPDQVVFLALNQEEAQETVAEFMRVKEWDFPVGLDDGKIAQLFSVKSFPTTVIIGPDGKVAFVNVGAQPDNEAKLKQAIEELLRSPAAPGD